MDKAEVKKMCHEHMHRYVCVWMEDGSMHDGIIESLDEEHLSLAVPVGSEYMNENEMHAPMYAHQGVPCGCPPPPCGDARAFLPLGGFGGYGGYGGHGYGGYPYYGGGYYPGRRRFRRLLLPLVGLTALSVLPLL